MLSLLDKSWLFEVFNTKTQQVATSFTLVLPPQSLNIKEGQRVSIQKTFGNAFIDDYGYDNLEITIRGITGTSRAFPTFKSSGSGYNKSQAKSIDTLATSEGFNHQDAFIYFRDEIVRYKHRDDYENYELRVYDLYEQEAYKCVLLDFVVDRTSQMPLYYPFTISLFVQSSFFDKKAYTPKKIQISQDPFSMLSILDTCLGWADTATKAWQTVNSYISKAVNYVTLVRNRLTSTVAAVLSSADTTLQLAKNAVDNIALAITSAHTLYTNGAMTLDQYAHFSETAKASLKAALAVWGYAVEQTSQTTASQELEVDAGSVKVENSTDVTGKSNSRNSTTSSINYSKYKAYTVKGGDNLLRIALATLGDENLWPFIAQINGLNSNSELVVGSVLLIPSDVGQTSISSIISENPLKDPYGTDIVIGADKAVVVNEAGDFSLVSGKSNVYQAVNLKIQTKVSSLIKQAAYGFSANLGSAGDQLANNYAKMQFKASLLRDERIESVNNIQLTKNKDQFLISADLKLVGIDQYISISTNL